MFWEWIKCWNGGFFGWFRSLTCGSLLLLFPFSAFCVDTTAAECSDVVQVWAVGSGLLPCPPVAAPQRGHGAPNSDAGRSEASQVPPGPNGCPPLRAWAAMPPDPLPPPVSWGHCEALCPNHCMSPALNLWTTQITQGHVGGNWDWQRSNREN